MEHHENAGNIVATGRKKTSLSLDRALMKIVSKRCVDLEIDKSDAVEVALKQWLTKERRIDALSEINNTGALANSVRTDTIGPSVFSGWIKLLEGVLSSGHAVAIETLTRTLQALSLLIQSHAEGRVDAYKVRSPEEVQADITRAIAEYGRINKSSGGGSKKSNTGT